MRYLLGTLVGLVVFLAFSLLHQLSRGLELGVLMRGDGVATAVVGPAWQWVPGVLALLIAIPSIALCLRHSSRVEWALAGFSALVAGIAGCVVAATAEVAASAPLLPIPQLWLVDGATEPGTWVFIGASVVLAVRARRRSLPSADAEL